MLFKRITVMYPLSTCSSYSCIFFISLISNFLFTYLRIQVYCSYRHLSFYFWIYWHLLYGHIFTDLFISLIQELFKAEPIMIRGYLYVCFLTISRFPFSDKIQASCLLIFSHFQFYLQLQNPMPQVARVSKCRSALVPSP